MAGMTRIAILTGAGISAESGLRTFRDADGLWEGHAVEDVATPEAFEYQPDVVQRFYDERRAALTTVEPNDAHRALADLERADGVEVYLVTQNVDDLHERAGSRHVHHLHGSLHSALCLHCGYRSHWDGPLADSPACPHCGVAELRPDVVWFGEVPHDTEGALNAVLEADVFCAIGTSGAVFPAAGLVLEARTSGIPTVELNLALSAGSHLFDDSRQGPATRLVPQWVAEVTGRG